DPRCAALQDPGATVQDSLALLADLYNEYDLPKLPYRIALRTEAATTRAARLQRERSALAEALAQMLPEQTTNKPPEAAAEERIEIRATPAPGAAGGFDVEIRLDGMPATPSDTVAQLLDSILQDLDGIPDDYLHTAGAGSRDQAADDESADDGNAPASD